MILFVISLLFSFLVFLFAIHVFLRDETNLIRKGIELTQVFDFCIYTSLVYLLFARLFYVIFNFKIGYLNPLVFFLFTYFPGLSFSGGLMAAIIFVIYYTQKKKWPLNFFVDYMSMALLLALPFGLAGTVFIQSFSYYNHVILPILFFVIFLMLIMFIYPRVVNGEIRQGVVGYIILVIISFVILTTDIMGNYKHGAQIVNFSNIPVLMLFVASFINLLRVELGFGKK